MPFNSGRRPKQAEFDQDSEGEGDLREMGEPIDRVRKHGQIRYGILHTADRPENFLFRFPIRFVGDSAFSRHPENGKGREGAGNFPKFFPIGG